MCLCMRSNVIKTGIDDRNLSINTLGLVGNFLILGNLFAHKLEFHFQSLVLFVDICQGIFVYELFVLLFTSLSIQKMFPTTKDN